MFNLTDKDLIDLKDELVSIHHAAWLSSMELKASNEAHVVFIALEELLDKYFKEVPKK